MEETVQGGGGLTVSGGVLKKTGHGTYCHGLVDNVMIRVALDDLKGLFQPK